MKFWPSRVPGKGVCSGAKIFGSALLQPARSVCVSSERFYHYFYYYCVYEALSCAAASIFLQQQLLHPHLKPFVVSKTALSSGAVCLSFTSSAIGNLTRLGWHSAILSACNVFSLYIIHLHSPSDGSNTHTHTLPHSARFFLAAHRERSATRLWASASHLYRLDQFWLWVCSCKNILTRFCGPLQALRVLWVM